MDGERIRVHGTEGYVEILYRYELPSQNSALSPSVLLQESASVDGEYTVVNTRRQTE